MFKHSFSYIVRQTNWNFDCLFNYKHYLKKHLINSIDFKNIINKVNVQLLHV